MPNSEVLGQAELSGIEALITSLSFAGQVRMDDDRLPKQVFSSELATGMRDNSGRSAESKTLQGLAQKLPQSLQHPDDWTAGDSGCRS